MADANEPRHALGDRAARQLANTTKTVPALGLITPRWLVRLLSWTPVESGTFRVNRVRSDAPVDVDCGSKDERQLPETFVDYEEQPREHTLSQISTVLDVHTRVSDLYSHPHDQIREQLRLTIESREGAAGKRAHQQRRLRPADQCRAIDARENSHRSTYP